VADATKDPATLRIVTHPDDEDDRLGHGQEDDRADRREIDDLAVLPDITTDDTDAGWGERRADNDERLLAERPPHWES
jgi:hypothetical protein